jgi:hypothetical protein
LTERHHEVIIGGEFIMKRTARLLAGMVGVGLVSMLVVATIRGWQPLGGRPRLPSGPRVGLGQPQPAGTSSVIQIGSVSPAVAVSGDTAFLAVGPRVIALDVRDPGHMVATA